MRQGGRSARRRSQYILQRTDVHTKSHRPRARARTSRAAAQTGRMGYPHKKHSPEGGEVRRSERPRKRAAREGGDDVDDDDDEPGVSRATRRGGGGGRGSRVPSTEELLSKGETPIARCAIVLGVLEKHETGAWFAHPVSDDDAPGYSDVIEDPI